MQPFVEIFNYYHILALVMVISPEYSEISDDYLLHANIIHIGKSLELIEENEFMHYHYNNNQLLEAIQERYQECKDYPPSRDVNNFLIWDVEIIDSLLRFSYNYRQFVRDRSEYALEEWKRTWYLKALRETDSLIDCWNNLQCAKSQYYNVSTKRYYLNCLRERLGKERFNAGNMPPNVPIWRFSY